MQTGGGGVQGVYFYTHCCSYMLNRNIFMCSLSRNISKNILIDAARLLDCGNPTIVALVNTLS